MIYWSDIHNSHLPFGAPRIIVLLSQLNAKPLKAIENFFHCRAHIGILKCPVLRAEGQCVGNGFEACLDLAAFINIKQGIACLLYTSMPALLYQLNSL